MKYLKTPFLFFCAFNLLICGSCSQNEKTKVSEKNASDSLNFYIEKMKDASFTNLDRLNYANKSLEFIPEATQNSKNIKKILNQKLSLFGQLNLTDSTLSTSHKLLKLSLKNNDSIAIGKNYTLLAYYHRIKHQKDSAFLFYKLAHDIYSGIGDTLKVGESLAQMAIIQSDFGDYIESDANAILALKYIDSNNLPYLIAIYNCIAISASNQKDYSESIYWYDKALNVSTKSHDKIAILNNKANSYRYLKDYKSAINILSELYKDTILTTSLKTKARILDNLTYTNWLNNSNLNVSNDLLAAFTIRQQENDLYGQIASYAHLSDFYVKRNRKTAIDYALKMLKMASRLKSPQDQLEALHKLIELENSNKVKNYYSHYLKLSDSINVAEKNNLNNFVKFKYDSEKNREENLQLKISTAEKQLEIQKEKTKNVILLSSGSSVFVFFLIFIYYKKQQHKQEKRTEVYKTEKRIAKKLHDEVANNVVNIMNKVQYTKNYNNQLLDDLEKVYFQTRNISHQNNAIETGAQFEEFLKNMLSGFNTAKTTIIIKDLNKVGLSQIAKEKQIELYRILQEIMVNMHKHSEATLVALTFKKDNNHFYINYSDNGIGLDIEELKFKNGLKNVETRIKTLNGTLNFDTSLNNGLKVFISFNI